MKERVQKVQRDKDTIQAEALLSRERYEIRISDLKHEVLLFPPFFPLHEVFLLPPFIPTVVDVMVDGSGDIVGGVYVYIYACMYAVWGVRVCVFSLSLREYVLHVYV